MKDPCLAAAPLLMTARTQCRCHVFFDSFCGGLSHFTRPSCAVRLVAGSNAQCRGATCPSTSICTLLPNYQNITSPYCVCPGTNAHLDSNSVCYSGTLGCLGQSRSSPCLPLGGCKGARVSAVELHLFVVPASHRVIRGHSAVQPVLLSLLTPY